MKFFATLAAVLVLAVAYLFLWPVPVDPVILGAGARDRLRPGEPSPVLWSLAPYHVRWLVDRYGDEPTPSPGRRP